jgi:hypothetical protein
MSREHSLSQGVRRRPLQAPASVRKAPPEVYCDSTSAFSGERAGGESTDTPRSHNGAITSHTTSNEHALRARFAIARTARRIDAVVK